MSNVLGKNILELLKLRGMSLRELGRRTGITNGGLSILCNRDQDTARATTVAAIAQALDVDVNDMRAPNVAAKYARMETRKHGLPIPLIRITEIQNNGDWEDIWLEGDLPRGQDSKAVVTWLPCTPFPELDKYQLLATIMGGDAMEPMIHDGDLVYIQNAQDTTVADAAKKNWGQSEKPRSGDIVLAFPKSDDPDATPIIRQVVAGDGGCYWLKAINPDYPGEKLVRMSSLMIGRVVGIFRRLD